MIQPQCCQFWVSLVRGTLPSQSNLLLPRLLLSDKPPVATMSSGTANFGRIRFDDLQWRRGYSPGRAYAQSKLADMLMARHLAAVAIERNWPLLSTVAHPGCTRTNLQTAGANLTRSQTEQLPPRRHEPKAAGFLRYIDHVQQADTGATSTSSSAPQEIM